MPAAKDGPACFGTKCVLRDVIRSFRPQLRDTTMTITKERGEMEKLEVTDLLCPQQTQYSSV